MMKTENQIAFASFAVALFALGLTIWQGYLYRQHNRLSVMPRLTIYDDMGSNGSGIYYKNDGLGPAIITHFLFEIEGKYFRANDTLAFIKENIPSHLMKYGFFVRAAGKNQTIVASSEPFLIIGTRSELAPREMIDFLKAINGLTIHIAYESMYGDAHRVRYVSDYIPEAHEHSISKDN
jgi:hypothetical protein